ncbi:MAG: hypothetical protein Phog2KO_45430 [Phototrophicaceae bacterium]
MQPIVNGLEDTYNNEINFVYLNANTDGAEVYEGLNLRGHPAFVIFLPDGTETFRTLGFQQKHILEQAIQDTLRERG